MSSLRDKGGIGQKVGGIAFTLRSACPGTSASVRSCLWRVPVFFCRLHFSAHPRQPYTPYVSAQSSTPSLRPWQADLSVSRPRWHPPRWTSLEKRDLGSTSTAALPLEVRASLPLETGKIPDSPRQPGRGVTSSPRIFSLVLRPAARVSKVERQQRPPLSHSKTPDKRHPFPALLGKTARTLKGIFVRGKQHQQKLLMSNNSLQNHMLWNIKGHIKIPLTE